MEKNLQAHCFVLAKHQTHKRKVLRFKFWALLVSRSLKPMNGYNLLHKSSFVFSELKGSQIGKLLIKSKVQHFVYIIFFIKFTLFFYHSINISLGVASIIRALSGSPLGNCAFLHFEIIILCSTWQCGDE